MKIRRIFSALSATIAKLPPVTSQRAVYTTFYILCSKQQPLSDWRQLLYEETLSSCEPLMSACEKREAAPACCVSTFLRRIHPESFKPSLPNVSTTIRQITPRVTEIEASLGFFSFYCHSGSERWDRVQRFSSVTLIGSTMEEEVRKTKKLVLQI